MLKKYSMILAGLCGAWFGYTTGGLSGVLPGAASDWFREMNPIAANLIWAAAGALLFLFLFSMAADVVSSKVKTWIAALTRIPMNEMAAGAAGLTAGLLLSLMVYPLLSWLGTLESMAQFAVSALFGYIGLYVGLAKKEELSSLWKSGKWGAPAPEEERWAEEHKILDTSVIIDGRIADICKTGFIEGTIVIPEFVLEELQHIADSSDLLKRNRGRRGLDILNKIQKELDVKVMIYEGDFEEISEVDSKLVKLAKVLQGKVVTNDFNLNKVCELQGVSVLNINDLANAVKPVVLPGEEIMVQVIKDGKEHGQGVAYLDDGTMIVVEGGRDYIGTITEVLVTSVLQTSAGRMIFAKPKLLEKAQ
ncbi:PIN/TRAM domain-containing protein [Paenibacillus phoenicis]|uniref:PIN/TRAM domain-containing protein n=1 Tax=Paenibacillus phoenicis TaxID=554117 RepID=A0ABU5PMV0_9BACL|nr:MULTISPECIES: PIN/TRAM domain-containing protein [Paenibacillus]EES71425.1 PIN domain protein [Paenibacillus sp. oral taxon 786 str. D14]MCT2197297.1 PIN/TRAM domain-containing protein [Paenibacillus sp. p3-SID1389]MEA3571255.1 PIN/TRAM domain-containing protein [Paenibacillus phoenicis]